MANTLNRRARRRRALGFATAALAAGVLAAPAGAATIGVTTQDDLFAPTGGACSLREAIQAANTDAAFGGCGAGSGADTVDIPAGVYAFTRPGIDDTNFSGDLDVSADLTIAGAGASATTIDAKGIDRVLEVRPGRVVTISGVTITGGHAPNGGTARTGRVRPARTRLAPMAIRVRLGAGSSTTPVR